MSQSPHILLVEDNPADIRLVREALAEHSVECELTVVTDGERAIRLIEQIDAGELPCPSLAIVDLNLPKRPGTDVLRWIRAGLCRSIPVIVMTSSDSQRDRMEVAAFEPSKYIRKPSRLEEFLNLGAVFKEMLYPVQ